MRPHFRFEDLEIWQLARNLAAKLHLLADELDKKRLYRYAEQLRAAGLSLTNNIAEGSGHALKGIPAIPQYLTKVLVRRRIDAISIRDAWPVKPG